MFMYEHLHVTLSHTAEKTIELYRVILFLLHLCSQLQQPITFNHL